MKVNVHTYSYYFIKLNIIKEKSLELLENGLSGVSQLHWGLKCEHENKPLRWEVPQWQYSNSGSHRKLRPPSSSEMSTQYCQRIWVTSTRLFHTEFQIVSNNVQYLDECYLWSIFLSCVEERKVVFSCPVSQDTNHLFEQV